MSQIVTIPGIGEATFPDDMSPDQIEAALNEQFGDKSQPEAPAPIQKPPTDLTRTNRFGESLGQLRQEAEKVRGEAMLGNLAETGIDLAQRVVGTVAEMPSAPLNLMRKVLPTQPIVSPEQGESVARFLNPFPAPEGSLARGIEKGVGELISGPTDPLVAAQIALGYRWPTQIAKGFQAQMLLGAPEAGKQLTQAETPEELGKGLISYGSALGFPLLIEAQLRKPPLPLSEKAVREIDQKGAEDASSIEEAAAVHGDVRPQPRESQGEMPIEEGGKGIQPQAARRVEKEAQVLLTRDEQAYLDAERQGMDVDVQVTPTLPGDQPFAGQIATIDRANNRILVNPQEFSGWLGKVAEKDRAKAVKSLLSEERLHLAADDQSALGYWNTLTAAEKLAQRRRYTGNWQGIDPTTGQALPDVLMGHEALRFRLQQLARITPREIAETNWLSREGFTVRSITALEGAVRAVRETLGTKASSEAIAILDRVQGNLDAAKAVLAGGQEPAALRKGKPERDSKEIEAELSKVYPNWRERFGMEGENELPAKVQALFEELRQADWQALKSEQPVEFTDEGAPTGFGGRSLRAAPDVSGEQAFPAALRKQPKDEFEKYVQAETSEKLAEHLAAFEYNLKQLDAPEAASINKEVKSGWKKKWERQREVIVNEIARRAEQSFPAALRKKQLQDTKQENLFLPPIAETAGLERNIFTGPTAFELERIAQRHVDDAFAKGKVPDFEAFRNDVGLKPEKLFYLGQFTGGWRHWRFNVTGKYVLQCFWTWGARGSGKTRLTFNDATFGTGK